MDWQLLDEAEQTISDALDSGLRCSVTSSFQADCMVLVHLLWRRRPEIPVLFLDTGYHFRETYAYRDEMATRFQLNLVNLEAAQSVAGQEAQFGILYDQAPDRCCHLRKVEPLFAGLSDYDVWFTALRRDQSPTRANLKLRDRFPLPSGHTLQKVSPLAGWSMRDVWQYLKQYEIPTLPLYDLGYSSVGCEPCTSRPIDPDNPRSGRWAGQKLECGIHISGK